MPDFLQKLSVETSALLVIDVQEKLLPAMHEAARCEAAILRMVQAGRVLGLPVIVTEQYPAGLGPTCPSVRMALGDAAPIEKLRFSACEDAALNRLRELGRRQVVVAGIESHVCVQQSVLDLLRHDLAPFVCADAVASRTPLDREMALARMRQAGAIITTVESVVFELLGEAGTDLFKRVLRIIK